MEESVNGRLSNISDDTSSITCEYCGICGPRHSFYSSSKRFCSITCSHSFSAGHRNKSAPEKHQTVKNISKREGLFTHLQLSSEMERQQCTSFGFDWGFYMGSKDSDAAPVGLFQHAPMSAHWDEIGTGMKVEVLNLDCPLNAKVFWIAQVIKVAGYKAKLRYEGFGDDASCDFWCNLCTLDVHAVGWCATIGKPLVPPQTIQYKYSNWKTFLVKRLTGAKTLPNDFQKSFVESMECPFHCNIRLEVVDKTQISRMRIGIVDDVVGGRLRLRYEDSEDVNDDFWCHIQSPLIHWVGWCEKVGHRILVASKDYKIKKGYKNVRQDLFAPVRQVKTCGFKVGMKLEAIDPLNLSAVCVATVKKVLKAGYLMIGIDGSEAVNGSDWFCYHCTSPSIFPVGFCLANQITLSVPKGYKEGFSWTLYLEEKHSQAAPVELFEPIQHETDFKPGMKLEAVDLMEPRLICVATINRIVGRLLHVHFDGWESEYDQWVDCRSPDIYPVGWCELVGYELQPPPNIQGPDKLPKKKKLKGQSFISKKKKAKKLSVLPKKPLSSTDPSVSKDIITDISAAKITTEDSSTKNMVPTQNKVETEISVHPKCDNHDDISTSHKEQTGVKECTNIKLQNMEQITNDKLDTANMTTNADNGKIR